MSQIELELAKAKKEVSFWQELAEHLKLPEPGILKALEHASGRYEMALQRRQNSLR